MSRHSVALNAIGQLTGTVPCATTWPFTFIAVNSGMRTLSPKNVHSVCGGAGTYSG